MDTLLASCLHEPTLRDKFYIPRFHHRLLIASAWSISEGSRLLDIGCGQGESCLVLAHLVGPNGHITGIDIAQPEYGSPFTVAASHTYAKHSQLGARLTFHLRTDAATFLRGLPAASGGAAAVLNAAVLCHSLFYFPDARSVRELFETLGQSGLRRVYLCEYSYAVSSESQRCHVLAAEAQRLFYRYKAPRAPGDLEQNVRAGVEQREVLAAAREAGYAVVREGSITPDETMREGEFEVIHVLGKTFRQRVDEEEGLTGAQREEIFAYLPRIEELKRRLAEGGVDALRTMDIWWAVLELEDSLR